MHAPRGEGKNVFEKLRVLVIDLGVRRNDGNGIFFVDYYNSSLPRVKYTFVMLDSILISAVVTYSWPFILLGWGGVCWGKTI